MKTQILAAIGETVLQPAALLNEALAANDRIKYFFSLLQLALSYAEHPNQPAGTLKRERIACGIDDPDLDTVVAEARASGKLCHVPGGARILAHIAADARLMGAPVLASHEGNLLSRIAQPSPVIRQYSRLSPIVQLKTFVPNRRFKSTRRKKYVRN